MIVALLATTVGLAVVAAAEDSPATIVSIAYQELQQYCEDTSRATVSQSSQVPVLLPVLLQRIEEAFGPKGLGIVEITNVPASLQDLRTSVLQQAAVLARLPPNQLETLTVPEADYTIGWSHGKEQFGTTSYDTRKGSFYFNPYQPHVNVFPSSIITTTTQELARLEQQLYQATHAMVQITLWIAQLCDDYLQLMTTPGRSTTVTEMGNHGPIYQSLQSKLNTKARLLYYYATTTNNNTNDNIKNDDDWCGWHKDHGSLTALLPGMFFDETEGTPEHCPTDTAGSTTAASAIPGVAVGTNCNLPVQSQEMQHAGLYIRTRHGSSQQQVRVVVPPTSIAIQLGETVEIMSGGKLVATPHAVKSSGAKSSLARASLAVFVQPLPDHPLPDCPVTSDESLRFRYRTTFGAFQLATTKAFL
jgi:2OG-Fe(II) oxygenase superfamily